MTDSMDGPRRIPIHRSLNRPHLLMGAERSLVLASGVLTAIIIFSGNLSPFSIGLGIGFWSVSFWFLAQIAKADPQMSRVYQRHIIYRPFYPAKGGVYATLPPIKRS